MAYQFDPELEEIIALLPVVGFDDPVAARLGMVEMIAPMNAELDFSALAIEDRQIEGLDADPAVTVRVYKPKDCPANTAGLLYVHGGGFAIGSIETEHGMSGELSEKLGIVVVSVEYRLAPEHPYPAGLNDCYAALQWMHDSADELGIDTSRIAICGQSAGGGLCAGLTLMSRDRNGPKICLQVLGIPELDDRLETTSMRKFTDTPLWNRPNAINSWKYYLGDSFTPGADDVPAYAAPARAQDLSGLPPAFVTAMEFDPLRDEAILYSLRMLEAGVPVELHTYPGTFHGSALVRHAAVSQRGDRDLMDALRRGLKLI